MDDFITTVGNFLPTKHTSSGIITQKSNKTFPFGYRNGILHKIIPVWV